MIYTFPRKVENRKCRHFETIKCLANFTHPCHPWRLNMIPVFIHMGNCHSSGKWFPPELNSCSRGSRADKQKGNKRKNWTLNYIKLTQLNKKRDLTATLHYAGGCFHFITGVNSDQRVTEYWHFNQGRFTKAHTCTRTHFYVHIFLPSSLNSVCWKLYERKPGGYPEITDKIQRDGILQILIKELGTHANRKLKYVPPLLWLYRKMS